ncbi:cTAGE family member 8 [Plecturocebus cupreus]
MRPDPNPYGFPWELVIMCSCCWICCSLLLCVGRSFRLVRSWLYVGREKKLAITVSGLIEEKCNYLKTLALFKKKKVLKKEKSKHSEQDELMADISKRIQSLEDESKSVKSQTAIKNTLNENSQLQESQKQLLQETKVWKEQMSELNKQKITFEDSKVHAEQVLNDKENNIKTLNTC